MGHALDLLTLHRALRMYAESLRAHREELDSLNVFPVPDGDTGTNMLLTQTAVVEAMDAMAGTAVAPDEVGGAISRASLLGARGNSGVILSQILHGWVEAMPADGSYGPSDLAEALRRAAAEAYQAVAKPVEGTVLSVLRDAAGIASDTAGRPGATSQEVLAAALDEARRSLARTTEQLPDLRSAGVVDAGGKGLVLFLDALLAALSGQEPSEPVGRLGPVGAATGHRAEPEPAFGYEVQFLLEAPGEAMPPLRASLGELGDSVVVVGGSGLFHVHVHTDQPDAAVDVGRRAGRPQDVRISPLADRLTDCLAGQARSVQVAQAASAVVAVADGAGVMAAFRSLGATVVAGGAGSNPADADLLSAIDTAPAAGVLVLPNHPDAIATAERAVAAARRDALMIPTRSIPAGLAAATAFNPVRSLEENAIALKEVVERARGGELARDARGTGTVGGSRSPDQWVVIVDGGVVGVSGSLADAAVKLASTLALDDAQLITVIAGAGTARQEMILITEALARSFPGLEVEALDGGQPDPPFIIGVE